MIETLIPFLLVAHVPIDIDDVYYGSQYIFNVSNTIEYDFGNITQHVNMIAKLKCRNSGDDSLICNITNASRQWYQEKGINSTHAENPRYIPISDVGPFEILFKDGKIDKIFVDASQPNTWLHILFVEIAEVLNIWWTNLNESEKGLSTVMDYKLAGNPLDNCQSLIKFTKQKKNDKKIGKFKIISIGRRLSIDPGMTLNFKKTSVLHSSCSKKLYLLYEHDNIQAKILNPSRIKAKSSYSRVVLSDNEFVSFAENVANYCPDSQIKCHYNIHHRISLALNSIDKSTTDLPSTIITPMDVLRNLQSTLALLYP